MSETDNKKVLKTSKVGNHKSFSSIQMVDGVLQARNKFKLPARKRERHTTMLNVLVQIRSSSLYVVLGQGSDIGIKVLSKFQHNILNQQKEV